MKILTAFFLAAAVLLFSHDALASSNSQTNSGRTSRQFTYTNPGGHTANNPDTLLMKSTGNRVQRERASRRGSRTDERRRAAAANTGDDRTQSQQSLADTSTKGRRDGRLSPQQRRAMEAAYAKKIGRYDNGLNN